MQVTCTWQIMVILVTGKTQIPQIGDVTNSKRPFCWSSRKCNCACVLLAEVQLRLRITRRSWQKFFAGKNFVKILVTAQTQLRSYSEQQRAFGNSNICNWSLMPGRKWCWFLNLRSKSAGWGELWDTGLLLLPRYLIFVTKIAFLVQTAQFLFFFFFFLWEFYVYRLCQQKLTINPLPCSHAIHKILVVWVCILLLVIQTQTINIFGNWMKQGITNSIFQGEV